MLNWCLAANAMSVALPTEGVDRNPLRRGRKNAPRVALPTEGVDRNTTHILPPSLQSGVALPTEGVDRNSSHPLHGIRSNVALPTEGVDRNSLYNVLVTQSL